jgi:hypothetical protein
VSTGGKVLLTIACIFIALIVVAAVLFSVGAYWFTQNKDRIAAGAKKSMEDGAAFGRQTDNQGCVDEALARHKRDNGFTSAIANNLFLQGCLRASRPTPNFCDAVPRQSEITKSISWRLDKCAEAGVNDQYCGNLFAQVQTFCESKRR